jgi:hypothetical protein
VRRLDLNLLPAFEALMVERSVTRAAERMSVGQPAMSASLARLRTFFGDPLLVREGRSLVPTPHALELAASLQEALDLIDSALRASRGFDPQAAERTAIENDGIDRILFASDFPFYDMAEVRKQVEDAVGREAAQRIYANRVPGLRLPTPAVSA